MKILLDMSRSNSSSGLHFVVFFVSSDKVVDIIGDALLSHVPLEVLLDLFPGDRPVLGSFAEYFSESLATHVKKGQGERARNGRHLGDSNTKRGR